CVVKKFVNNSLCHVYCPVCVSNEDHSVLISRVEEGSGELCLGFTDHPERLRGFNHSLTSFTIVPVPNFKTLFGLTSTLSLTRWNSFPSYRKVPLRLPRSFRMSLLPLKLSEACFLETSWSGITTTFSGLLPMVMVGKSSKSMLTLVLMRDEAGVLTKTM